MERAFHSAPRIILGDERASLPLESVAVQLGCSEFIFAFLLEPFLARDTGWTVAAGKF